MAAFSVLSRCRYNRGNISGGPTDGDRRLLGQRQSLLMAGAAGARIQETAVQQPRSAIFQAGAQIAANAGPELARAPARVEGRGLCLLRIVGDALLPRP